MTKRERKTLGSSARALQRAQDVLEARAALTAHESDALFEVLAFLGEFARDER